jgi:hypothetical protein
MIGLSLNALIAIAGLHAASVADRWTNAQKARANDTICALRFGTAVRLASVQESE